MGGKVIRRCRAPPMPRARTRLVVDLAVRGPPDRCRRRPPAWAPCRRRACPSRGRSRRPRRASASGNGSTTAVMASPNLSSGTPTATASRTDGMQLEHLLDLLGEDLLAAGVDAHRPAAEQGDRAVGLDRGVVAGDRVALAVDHEERGRATSRGPCSSRRAGGRVTATRPTSPEPGDDVAAVVGDHPGVRRRARTWPSSSRRPRS